MPVAAALRITHLGGLTHGFGLHGALKALLLASASKLWRHNGWRRADFLVTGGRTRCCVRSRPSNGRQTDAGRERWLGGEPAFQGLVERVHRRPAARSTGSGGRPPKRHTVRPPVGEMTIPIVPSGLPVSSRARVVDTELVVGLRLDLAGTLRSGPSCWNAIRSPPTLTASTTSPSMHIAVHDKCRQGLIGQGCVGRPQTQGRAPCGSQRRNMPLRPAPGHHAGLDSRRKCWFKGA
jgi:hypothetical protein